MTLSAEALAARAALEAEVSSRRRDVFDGRRPMVQGPRTLGPLALAGPGCEVFTDPARRRGADDDWGLGGTLLEIVTTGTVDRETGEIVEHRAFRTYDPFLPRHEAFRTFPEALFAQCGVAGVNDGKVRMAIRRFAGWVAEGKGPIVGEDERLLADAHRLAVILLGGTL